jgi:multidrug efflux system outer membrane protein
MRRSIACSLLVITLAGCAIGPNYRKPEIETPPAWRLEEKEAKDLTNTTWWELFNDPVLNDLVRDALKENKDLRIATSRVEEFYGRYGATRANLFPQLGYGASGGKSGFNSTSFTTYDAQFSASWEIDLWGKLRRATEAARADLAAAEDVRSGVILSLVTSVASAYIDLRSLDRQLEIARQTAKSREE